MSKTLSAEQIEKNFDRFQSLLEKTGDRSEPIAKMLEEIGEQVALAPASSKLSYHNAFPGGLVDHSLRVLSNTMKICKTFEWNVPRESLIIATLFHDLGKVGFVMDDGKLVDFYVPQESEWHKDKLGQLYMVNSEMPFLTTQQRSVFICNHYGVKLKKDEYLSILLNDGFVVDENKPYCLKVEPLVYAVMTADYISCMQEKDNNGTWTSE